MLKNISRTLSSRLSLLTVFTAICLFPCPSIQAAAGTPSSWTALDPIVQSRVNQREKKMKLQPADAEQFKAFLANLQEPTPKLKSLQTILPKTTVELLMAVSKRGVSLNEAEKMAEYLKEVVDEFQFTYPEAFDENTSHIIGREWSEIDYSGEGMTWQKQKAKYRPYGIQDFKTLGHLKKFIPVESKLSYFDKTYKPKK